MNTPGKVTADFNMLPPMEPRAPLQAPSALQAEVLCLYDRLSVPRELVTAPLSTAPAKMSDIICLPYEPMRAAKLAALVDGPLPEPSEEQARAIAILIKPDGIVKRLSGKAGTGKSTVVRHVAAQVAITICATTAKAAMNVGGSTLDRLFSYDRTKDDTRNERQLNDNMAEAADIIVIDEASMLGRKMANHVKRVARSYNKTIILVGDWAQAKPVKDEWVTKSTLLDGAITVFLTQSHRQTDRPFLDALDALSAGCRDHPSYSVFEACKVRREPEGDQYVRLYATNALALSYNRGRLADLTATTARVAVHVTATKHRGGWFPDEEDKLIDESRFMHGISLKLGARLLCTKNEYKYDFVNGDMGELVNVAFFSLPRLSLADFAQLGPPPEFYPAAVHGRPVVAWLSQFTTPFGLAFDLSKVAMSDLVLVMKPDSPSGLVYIPLCVRELCDTDESPLYSFEGFPVRLGWAATIHSAQGATCDNVYVDMGSILRFPEGSRHGLAYVAISRCRTLAGLKIYGWNPSAIECDSEVWLLLAPPPPPPACTPITTPE